MKTAETLFLLVLFEVSQGELFADIVEDLRDLEILLALLLLRISSGNSDGRRLSYIYRYIFRFRFRFKFRLGFRFRFIC